MGAQDTLETGVPPGRRTARGIVAGQLAITGVLAAGFALALDLKAGYSALVGGGVNALANLYFARRVFGSGTSPRAILRNLFVGEFLKIALTVALFVLALKTLELSFAPLIITYAATLLGFWIALLRTIDR